jgi:hypothetical protein
MTPLVLPLVLVLVIVIERLRLTSTRPSAEPMLASPFKLGIWSFSGVWSLKFEVFR